MALDPGKETREALHRFESGQTDFEEIIDARGIRSFLIRDGEDPRFFRIESEQPGGGFSVSATGIRLPPSPHRPKELPKQVPFVAEATTMVMIMPATGSVVVRWENPPDPASSFQRVRESLLHDGWLEETAAPEDMDGNVGHFSVEMRKGGAARTLTLFEGNLQADLVLREDRVT